MTYVYRIFSGVAALIVIPIVLAKAVFGDRGYLGFLGVYRNAPARRKCRGRVWIHASSVGEVKAALLTIDATRQAGADVDFILTVFTPRGMRVAREEVASDIYLSYPPLDLPFFVRRAFAKIDPSILVLTETELWPSLMQCAYSQRIPVVVINGRLTDRTLSHYRALDTVFRPVVEKLDMVHTQSRRDRERYLKLGARESVVFGEDNLKTAGLVKAAGGFDGESIRRELRLSSETAVFVAGSTRDGEEETILEAFKKARKSQNNLKLLLAPRHTTRVPPIERMISDSGLTYTLRSRIDSEPAEVILLDTMGELWKMYGICQAAFVGGSLVPIGGHNPLEPLSLGVPTCFGPHMENSAELTERLLENKLAFTVRTSDEIAEFVTRCLRREIERPEIEQLAALFASDIDLVAKRIVELAKVRRNG